MAQNVWAPPVTSTTTATAPTTTVSASGNANANAAMGYAFGVALVASTVSSAYSSYAAGRANREIANFNAAMQEIRARDAIFRGQLKSAEIRKAGQRMIGDQRAGFAGQGVDVSSGSALDVQKDTAYMAEMDALTAKNNAFREAFGFQVDAQQTRFGGQMAYNAGLQTSAGTILGGAAQGAGVYYKANRS